MGIRAYGYDRGMTSLGTKIEEGLWTVIQTRKTAGCMWADSRVLRRRRKLLFCIHIIVRYPLPRAFGLICVHGEKLCGCRSRRTMAKEKGGACESLSFLSALLRIAFR